MSDFHQRCLMSRIKLADVIIGQKPRTNQLALLVAHADVLGCGINLALAKHALNQFSVGAFNFVGFGRMVTPGWAQSPSSAGEPH